MVLRKVLHNIEKKQHTPHIVEVTFSEASYYFGLIINDVRKADDWKLAIVEPMANAGMSSSVQ